MTWYTTRQQRPSVRISVISIPAPAPEMADVLRAPFREFFTRLHSIVETGEVPAVEPLDSCPAWW